MRPAENRSSSQGIEDVRDPIRRALLSWFRRGHRDLPWRRTADPYAIWISEIMLQQTRVETVKEYFRRFQERFPTPRHLAAADLEEVLSLWSGLGYYARARNMHAAAREIVAKHGGAFPSDPEAVRQLPGIGAYTAGAILSLAFRQRAALVDGNVIRVFSRLFAIADPVESATARRRYWELAEALVPEPEPDTPLNHPGDFNQALMELGATLCLPRNPTCLVCPVANLCRARQEGRPEDYPPKKREREVPVVDVVTLVLAYRGTVLLARRPPMGLWGGLWEPPTGEVLTGETVQDALRRLGRERLGLELAPALARGRPLPPFEHTLSHRHMRFMPSLVALSRPIRPKRDGGYDDARFIDPAAPAAIGLSAWVSSLLAALPALATRVGKGNMKTDGTRKQ